MLKECALHEANGYHGSAFEMGEGVKRRMTQNVPSVLEQQHETSAGDRDNNRAM